jgi:MinD superfamily P-loop ATPase
MPEIVIISGKGGTGKTSLTGAFAALARSTVLCDLDVDAPDLHLILEPIPRSEEDFVSGVEARIDPAACTGCGICADMCRFEGVRREAGTFAIDPLRCEGCGVCARFCPAGAVTLVPRLCGRWGVSDTRFGTMVHAQLFPGQENSGRLVQLLRGQAREAAAAEGAAFILCDGAPGVGCPVISSLSGTALAVIVTEPTPSGRHDLERVSRLCAHFRVQAAVILNKADLNPEEAARIEELCRERGHEIVARLPHDPVFFTAMAARRTIPEGDSPLNEPLRQAWDRIQDLAREADKPRRPKDRPRLIPLAPLPPPGRDPAPS